MSRPSHVRLWLAVLSAALVGLLAPGGAESSADHARTLELTFPTDPTATFSDDYHVGRGEGRPHRATDLFAPAGTPVYAARGGEVTRVTHHRTAGWAVHVRGPGGRTYAYYHLGPAGGDRGEAIADGVVEGARVSRGQPLGSVGDSGNAAGSSPHLHFEIHDDGVTDPYGGNRLNPVASLRAALARGDYVTFAAHRWRAPVLRRGDRGPRVTAWQHELNAHRHTPISADSVFGPETGRATRELQRARGLTVDGIVGPRTRAASAAALPPDTPLLDLLRLDDRGPRVAEWQQQLDTALDRPVAVDGVFGPQTLGATRALQRAQRRRVDGVVGPRTRQAMAEALR
jgi:peptidoglycan hydrolase-like protein with peptidoglycan-binding domain